MLGLVIATPAAHDSQAVSPLLVVKSSEPEWVDRAIVLPALKVAICTVEKNGLTEINKLTAVVMNEPHKWFQYSPRSQGLSFEAYQQYLRDSSWRKVVVYRDPMERFLSAYFSKCLQADTDGREHCHKVFGLSDEQVTIENVVASLPTMGHKDPHWALQTSFCGGTFRSQWNDFTDHIPLASLSRILKVFEGRVDSQAMERARSFMQNTTDLPNHPQTNASGKVRDESVAIREALFDYYREDYRHFHSNFVFLLDEVSARRQMDSWEQCLASDRLRLKQVQVRNASL